MNLPDPAPTQEQQGPVWAEVSVASRDMNQVAFVDGATSFTMKVSGVRFGRIELLGEVFLPKGCAVTIIADFLAKANRGEQAILAGVVRSTSLAGLQPSYTLAIDFDKAIWTPRVAVVTWVRINAVLPFGKRATWIRQCATRS